MYQQGLTIKKAVDKIAKEELVLPAIQREFVWRPNQICSLFDSVMQGYPFGDFLFWNIHHQNSNDYRYFRFMCEYHQRDKPHCEDHGPFPQQQVVAVLDGQQRLTAFNIGLRGSMAVKLRNLWWNNPDAFPIKVLALDLLTETVESDEGNKYLFDFIELNKTGLQGNQLWYRVGDIFNAEDIGPILDWINDQDLENAKRKQAMRTVLRLHKVIHSEPTISYYEEPRQDIEHVLRIFIRRNSGGTQLSYSDLLLSIATSQWKNLDARKEVHQLVEDLNRTGLNLTKDFVLKAGLMLSDISSVKFQVRNFKHDNMETIEKNWKNIKQILQKTCNLVAGFGFDRANFRAVSALLPIAYYFYKTDKVKGIDVDEDELAIKLWLIRSSLKLGIWGSGLDTLLTALRKVIRESVEDDSSRGFPVALIHREMGKQGKSLHFNDEEIEDLADMEYSNKQIFALLTLVFPFVDCKRNFFHVDHIFPKSRFETKKLRKEGIDDEKIEVLGILVNRIGNLQLLSGEQNLEKQDKLPGEWLEGEFKNAETRQEYIERHLLQDLPSSIQEFENFYTARRERLRKCIANLVNR